MIVAFFPTTGGTVCLLGMESSDLATMSSRQAEPAAIDMRDAVNVGIAIPTFVQVIYVEDRAEFDTRVDKMLVALGLEGVGMIPLDQMPSLFLRED